MIGSSQYMHATKVELPKRKGEGIVVAVRNPDGSQQLETIEDPVRKFWVTKPEFRTHEYKKEFEYMDKLEEHACVNKNLSFAISDALGVPKTWNVRAAMTSPYVYGALDIETLIKKSYMEKYQGPNITPVFGAMDIEQDIVTSEGYILCNSVGFGNDVYCFVCQPFIKNHTYEELMRVINSPEFVGAYIKEYGFNIHVKVCKDEKQLLLDYHACVHEHKPDFVGIWNMGYDIPTIIDRLEVCGLNADDIMPHPEVHPKYKKVKFKKDTSDKNNFAELWDWFHCPGYTQYIDSMQLYARLRKVMGQDPSYSLDYISQKELKKGKLELAKEKGHYIMQTQYPLEYVAYNIIDILLIMLMHKQNNDVGNMLNLCGFTHLSNYSKQTKMVSDAFFKYCIERDVVPGTVMGNIQTHWDKIMAAVGGAVLDPMKIHGSGIRLFDNVNTASMLHRQVCDIDVSEHALL